MTKEEIFDQATKNQRRPNFDGQGRQVASKRHIESPERLYGPDPKKAR